MSEVYEYHTLTADQSLSDLHSNFVGRGKSRGLICPDPSTPSTLPPGGRGGRQASWELLHYNSLPPVICPVISPPVICPGYCQTPPDRTRPPEGYAE